MKACRQCQRSYPNSFAVCPADGAPLIQQGEWTEGALLRGKYRIIEKLGQGAMGAVYKALHVRFKELRALKVMAPELANDKMFRKRFEREAILARKLHHPNAVHVEDIDETDDGQPFIVMEYIAGRSLSKVLKSEGQLLVDRTCTLSQQIASALHAAHSLGIVHRDIKPDNIILLQAGNDETAKVLDFGIAKMKEGLTATSPGMALTQTGMVVGTPFYMSPEQAKGIPGDRLDGRSDLYSLGIVMYQMLTGQLPLEGDTPMQVLVAHIETPPPTISRVRPDLQIPDSVAAIVMKCLAKDPQHRPQTGAQLVAELQACEAEKTRLYPESAIAKTDRAPSQVRQQARANASLDSVVTAAPPSFVPDLPPRESPRPEPSVSPSGRPSARASHLDSFVFPETTHVPKPVNVPTADLARLPAYGGSLFASRETAQVRGTTDQPSPLSTIGKAAPLWLKRKSIWAAVASLIVIGGAFVWYESNESNSPSSPVREPQSAEQESTSKPFAKDQVIQLLRSDGPYRAQQMAKARGIAFPITFKTEYELTRAGADDSLIRALRALAPVIRDSEQLVTTLHGHNGQVYNAVFSPNGQRIATAGADDTAKVWTASGQLVATLSVRIAQVFDAAFSPDGRRIVTAVDDGMPRVWDADNGQLLITLRRHSRLVLSAQFSPDGRRIVTASAADNTAKVWNALTGQLLATLRGHTGGLLSAVFSPDGQRIATASRDKTARVWNAATGQLQATLVGHTGGVNSAVFSPDGRRVVTASADDTAKVWSATNGQLLAVLQHHTSPVYGAVFSPDGQRVVTASDDHTACVFDSVSGQLFTTLQGHADSVRRAMFSPDGRRIVTASWDTTARVWDAASGHLLVTLQGHTDSVNSAVFSADGQRIVTASYDTTARVWDVGTR